MAKKTHPSFFKPKNLLGHQDKVWDRDYRLRGSLWSKDARDLPKGLDGKVVLEAGVGNGKTLKAILKQNPKEVFAFDFSPHALNLCRKGLNSQTNLILDVADIRALPYDDSLFDAAVLYYILDNLLANERTKAVNEVRRVLRPGGRVLFADFAVGDFREETGNVLEMVEPHTPLKKNGILCHFFSEEEVSSLFSGFTKIHSNLDESKPIRNKEHLVRRTISAIYEK
jgi:ubiquinone/menaquinone biosynthesis C-methylase UbiE